MKYGVLLFDNTENLGDDIQSYAQLRFLPRVDYYLNREALDSFESVGGEQVSMIMNAWFLHAKFNWPPASCINPLFVSSHFSSFDRFGIGYKFIDGLGGDYLRHYGPIGVRDESTKDALEEHGVPAYVTGCLTLTLQKRPDVRRTDKVVLCDIDDALADQVTQEYSDTQIERVTHNLIPHVHNKLSVDDRFNMVEDRLALYQSAKLVITTRLHCALPCLALGTPVLFVVGESGYDRFGSFLKYLHHCPAQDLLDVLDKEAWIEHPLQNADTHIGLRNGLEEIVNGFIEKCEQEIVPEPFEVPLDKLHAWQKQLIAISEERRFEALLEADAWLRDLSGGKDYLEQHAAELEDWTATLQQVIDDEEREKGELKAHISDCEARIALLENARDILGRQLKQAIHELREKDEALEAKDRQVARLKRQLNSIRGSVSFKTGRVLTFVPRRIKRMVSGK